MNSDGDEGVNLKEIVNEIADEMENGVTDVLRKLKEQVYLIFDVLIPDLETEQPLKWTCNCFAAYHSIPTLTMQSSTL